MNKFKLPLIIFAAVFVVSAAGLFLYIKNDINEQPADDISAPAWVQKNGSSGKQPIAGETDTAEKEKEPDTMPQIEPVEKTATEQANKTVAKQEPVKKPETKQTEPDTKTVAETFEDFKDAIVTEVFLDNLATYIADNYQPAGSQPYTPAKGYSSATFKGINTHFGLNLRGLMPDAKSLDSAREKIWAELLAPKYLNKLYGKYGATLLDLVEEKGIMAERKFAAGDTFEIRALTTRQRAEMFRASAAPLRHVSAVMTTIARNKDLLQAMDSYLKAEKRVEIANGLFQLDVNQAQTTNSEGAKTKAALSGKELKEAITIREKIKTGIIDKITVSYRGKDKNLDDAFYITKWMFRRVKNNENRLSSILAGCSVLDKLANDMTKRAALIEKNS